MMNIIVIRIVCTWVNQRRAQTDEVDKGGLDEGERADDESDEIDRAVKCWAFVSARRVFEPIARSAVSA
jgi:hypothetical protein